MKTSRKQTSPLGGAESTSSQGVFRVNPSVVPERDRERTMTVTSGRRCYERYGRYSPLGSLARTLLESSRWYSPAVSLRWEAKPLYSERITRHGKDGSNMSSRPSARTLKTRDIPSSRLLFRLVPSARRTGGTGCGSSQGALLPTPAVMEDRRKPNGDGQRQKKLMSNLNPYSITALLPTVMTQGLKRGNKDGKTEFMPLELLPTPTAIDSGSGRMNRSMSANAKERPTIALAAKMGLLPTPMSTDIRHERRTKELRESGAETMGSRRNGESRPNGLTDWMDFHGMLPTLVATDYKQGCSPQAMTRKDNKTRADTLRNLPSMTGNHSRQTGGETSQLNPLFVEDMMGFPPGWTTLPFLGRDGGRKA